MSKRAAHPELMDIDIALRNAIKKTPGIAFYDLCDVFKDRWGKSWISKRLIFLDRECRLITRTKSSPSKPTRSWPRRHRKIPIEEIIE